MLEVPGVKHLKPRRSEFLERKGQRPVPLLDQPALGRVDVFHRVRVTLLTRQAERMGEPIVGRLEPAVEERPIPLMEIVVIELVRDPESVRGMRV